MDNTTKALAVIEDFSLPALPSEGAMSEEMDGLSISFDRVRIPSGGGLAFEVPGEDDDEPDTEKEIVGVIVYHHPVNAYWGSAYTGQNNPPKCSSMNGKEGKGEPGMFCPTCEFNQFGSDAATGGKLCKNMRRIYILRNGELFPLLLTLPPTSLGNFAKYLSRRILQKGLRTHHVVTRIGLKKATSNSGIAYSQATFKMQGVFPPEMREKMEQYRNVVKDMALGVGIENNEYMNGAKEEEEPLPF